MNEDRFAHQVRLALNEGAEHLDYKTVLRLEQARKAALASAGGVAQTARLPVLATAGGPDIGSGFGLWLQRVGLLVPLLALLVGFIGIYEWRHSQAIEELANIDFALLMDEAPLDAYADKGFTAFLQSDPSQFQ